MRSIASPLSAVRRARPCRRSLEKTLDLEKKEYTYYVPSEDEDGIKEYHRVVFKGNQSINVTVSFTGRWADKLGGEICDHILKSAKFNEE